MNLKIKIFNKAVWLAAGVAIVLPLTGCAPGLALQGLALPTDASHLSGQWEGRYSCEQGLQGVTMSLQGNALGMISGRVTLHAVADNPKATSGGFDISGHYDTRGNLKIQTAKPLGLKASDRPGVTLSGVLKVDGSGKSLFTGFIPECQGQPFYFVQGGSEVEVAALAPKEMPAILAVSLPSSTAVTERSIAQTSLTKLFAKHPYDGTPKTWFPRVAVTIHDWSRQDCWVASAMIWYSDKNSEAVTPFKVCWSSSLGFALNNATNLHLFMEQTVIESSGNVRNNGPKAPLIAVPNRTPFGESKQDSYHRFIQQLVLDTGWQSGAPTNIWIVEFNSNTSAIKIANVKANN